MDAYKLYWVVSGKFKPGINEADAVKWWREKGAPDLLSEPGAKALRAYAGQFGLAGEYHLEVWLEIESYAAFDKMDKSYIKDPALAKKKRDLWKEADAYFEWGPARLMGDWPESALLPE